MRGISFFHFFILVALAVLAGCIVNPVTGRNQFSLISVAEEKALGQKYAPQQIESDSGIVGDRSLNAYVDAVGQKVAAVSHRPDWGYTFQVVNAMYVNAYAFPDGTICVTRGMMLELTNEAQLAALLGHEIAHVCARHSAMQQTQSLLSQGAALALSVGMALSEKTEDYAEAAGIVSLLASQTYLAKYSRTDELEADRLGLEYMVKAGYDGRGMVELMELLIRVGGNDPSLVDQLFSTHPMSSDRRTAVLAQLQASGASGGLVNETVFAQNVSNLKAQQQGLSAQQQALALAAKGNAKGAAALVKGFYGGTPSDLGAAISLAEYLFDSGDYRGAGDAAHNGLSRHGENRRLLAVALKSAFYRKDYAAALELTGRMEKLIGQSAGLMLSRAVCYRELGKPELAAAACRKGIELDDDGLYREKLETILNELTGN